MASVFADGMAANSATQLTYFVGLNQVTPYLDLAGLLSAENNRLYRQGMVYHVRVQIANSNTTGARNISTLKNTWAIRKSWALARKTWLESTAHERKSGVRPGRWNDFKVFLDDNHVALGSSVGPTTEPDGEWNYTRAPPTDGGPVRQFKMLGSTAVQAWGILSEYDEMRDQDVDTPASGGSSTPFSGLVAEIVNAQGDQIQEEGDLPPYGAADLEAASGNLLTYYMHSPSTGGGDWVTNTQGYIPVPLGLMKFETGLTEQNCFMRVDFKPGKYKGVHAEVMG